MNRRDFLRILLASPIAATVDVEALIWTPKPIITVPAMPGTYGHIIRATYPFWRNQTLYGGMRGGGKTMRMEEAFKKLFDDGSSVIITK